MSSSLPRQVTSLRRAVLLNLALEIQTEGQYRVVIFVSRNIHMLHLPNSIPSAWYSTTDPSSFATFLSLSDVILLSLPSTPATTRIINAKTIAYLKPSTILVNVGRGNAIDTDALVAALDDGKISGVVLDVTDPEPLPDGHTLFGRKNVIITPHLSGFASNYQDRVVDILIANVDRYNEGKELLNVVDRDRGY